MNKKVSYFNIRVNFSELVVKLDRVALEQAKTAGKPGFVLLNSLIVCNEEMEKQNPYILVKMNDGSNMDETFKKPVLEYIRTYVKYFCGENFAKQINESNLLPLFDNSTKPPAHPVTESSYFISRRSRMISDAVDMLFEEEATEPKLVKGYSVEYTFYRQGKPTSTLPGAYDITKQTAANLFSNVWSDITRLEIRLNGKPLVPIGNMIAGATEFFGDAFTASKINISDAEANIAKVIKTQFPQSQATPRVYDAESIRHNLMQQGKWESDYDEMFKNCKYCIVIEVDHRNKSINEFSRKVVAEICTKAFGDATRLKINKNKITENNVIFVENYQSEFKAPSKLAKQEANKTNESYEKYLKRNNIDNIVDLLFEQQMVSEATTDISVAFFVKDPTKENALEHELTVLVGPAGGFDANDYPKLSSYDGYEFKYWNPDPNEFTDNYYPKGSSLSSSEPKPQKTVATFAKVSDRKEEPGTDAYIIPYKNLVSKKTNKEYQQDDNGNMVAKRQTQNKGTN